MRQRLGKPHLPFLIIVAKIDLVKSAAKEAIEHRIGLAFAGDVPEVHYVQNYTRSELEKSSKLIDRVSAEGLKKHEQINIRQEYDNWVKDCTKRSSDHLFVVRCALNAVMLSDDISHRTT